MEIFIVLLIVAVAGVVIAGVKSGSSGPDVYWKAAAQRLGLAFEKKDLMSSPVISGTRRGFSIHIDTYTKGGTNSTTYTRYRIGFKKPLGLGLRLARAGPLAGASERDGAQDISVGDEEFDKSVVVRARDSRRVSEFLTTSRKLKAVRFLLLYPGSTINDSGIECETRTVERNPDRIVQTVQRMSELAEHLTSDEEEVPDYLEAMNQSGEVDEDLEFRGRAYAPEPEPIPLRLEDILVTDTDPEAAVEQPHHIINLAEEIGRGVELDGDPATLDQPVQPDSVAPKTASQSEDDLGISHVVGALFAEGQSTSEAEEMFESKYKGRSFAGCGTLKNVRSYRFDLVFGNDPGTRAEIELDIVSGGSASRTPKAVVQLPVEMEDRLRSIADKQVAFEGSLIQCDVFMKTLFFSDGQIDEVNS